MPNTITNQKHNEIVATLISELKESGMYEMITPHSESGYDISCRKKTNGKEVFFTVLLFSDRNYDATTLMEWKKALEDPDSYYFVAAVKRPELCFYFFDPRSFISYCSVPRFKINCSLQKKDFSKYITIHQLIKRSNGFVETAAPKRRSSKQLTIKGVFNLDRCWNSL